MLVAQPRRTPDPGTERDAQTGDRSRERHRCRYVRAHPCPGRPSGASFCTATASTIGREWSRSRARASVVQSRTGIAANQLTS